MYQSETNYTIDLLINISDQINRYFAIFIFIFGTCGNILNIVILSDRTLRHIPCVFLFLIASISSLISIDLGLITRMLAGWASDPTYTIGWICKLRTFLVFATRLIVFWLFVLSTIDRWLSSSVYNHQRRLNTMKNVRYATLTVILMSVIMYAQLFYCYEANLVRAPFPCYTKSSLCQIVTDLTFALFTIIIPLLLMSMFSLMTIFNFHQSQQRIFRTGEQRSKRTERYLLRMLCTQIIALGLLTLPQAIIRLYAAFVDMHHSELQTTIDMFVYNILLLLTYLASAMPFYIYTLTGGSLFRRPLSNLKQRIVQFFLRQTE
ncbi:unnamed protein product [Adineta ricciae]|uniref:G-protein coupled receptors family 1 profile domain-containing protein n=1 Tax=Adineta ricciae TaxID=249248 RepID=A0A815H436_ADIRI|nr:unnamed protein product [Adineta ricciae]CAF1346885.1 unnamed protein product [Adineta ricciae]